MAHGGDEASSQLWDEEGRTEISILIDGGGQAGDPEIAAKLNDDTAGGFVSHRALKSPSSGARVNYLKRGNGRRRAGNHGGNWGGLAPRVLHGHGGHGTQAESGRKEIKIPVHVRHHTT